jgi:hypothetical protein
MKEKENIKNKKERQNNFKKSKILCIYERSTKRPFPYTQSTRPTHLSWSEKD